MKDLTKEQIVKKVNRISLVFDKFSDDSLTDMQSDEADRTVNKLIDKLSKELDISELCDIFYDYDFDSEQIVETIVTTLEERKD